MFDYFISLGSSCITSASMSKFGLRSYSGPFDWLVTNKFDWILKYMETDFQGFLQKNDLERYDNNENHFKLKESGFLFMHETGSYEEIKSKYQRRIERFIKMEKNKVCFLRSCASQSEIEYIIQNRDYINHVIKKYNVENEIVFLLSYEANVNKDFPFKYFKKREKYKNNSRKNMRAWFDGMDNFIRFCGENYSALSLINNLAVDRVKEDKLLYVYEHRYRTLEALLNYNFSKDMNFDKIIIYGIGATGKEFYKKIRESVKVIAFIDRDRAGYKYDGIKIISPKECKNIEGGKIKIVVSATHDFKNIETELKKINNKMEITSLDDILEMD